MAMRQAREVRARVQADEAEIGALAETIRQLQHRVRDGGPGWRSDLEELAARCARRRTLESELEGLRWVLTAETGWQSGGQRSA
jgi:hypothetical protein